MKLELIRENIFKLLENETKFNQGDTVTTQKDGDGIILLAKHPYYSIQLNNTGVTKSYHFTDLNTSEPIESEFGKYELDEITVKNPTKLDYETWRKMMVSKSPTSVFKILEDYKFDNSMSLPVFFNGSTPQEIAKTYTEVSKLENWSKENINESPLDKIVKLDGILTVDEDIFLTDILSDIRSLTGITTVRNNDIRNEDLKTKLNIKIDPYPFGDQGIEKIQSILIKKIKQIPGVKDFYKVKHVEKLPNNQKLRLPSSSPIPVSNIDELQ